MSTDGPLFEASLEGVFHRLCTPEAVRSSEHAWPEEMWSRLEEAGFATVSIGEERGGSGGTLADALVLLQVAGRHACPLPLAETAVLAGWLLTEARISLPAVPLTVAADPSLQMERTGGSTVLRGVASGVPWGRTACIVAAAAADDGVDVTVLSPAECLIEEHVNVAGEPRDTVHFDVPIDEARVSRVGRVCLTELHTRGAMTRIAMIAGALMRVLELSMRHASDRVQFGRPLLKFQAIQHHLATMAGEVATVLAAAELVRDVAESPEREIAVAAAKARAGEAATKTAALAHQIHGAIGTTREHDLQLFTRRLLAWRDEYGSEFEWARVLGERALSSRTSELWSVLAGT